MPPRRDVLASLGGTLLALATRGLAAAAPGRKAGQELAERLETSRGPIFLYRPAHTRPRLIVVYVHGFFDTAPSTWQKHDLAAQFRASGLPALFIVPEAPARSGDAVVWPSLPALLQEVARRRPKLVPRSRDVVAVGHSAAYRTIAGWLDCARLRQIVLVDGLYGFEDEYAGWLRQAGRRLVLVVLTTRKWALPFAARHRGVLRLPRIPAAGAVPARARRARLVVVSSQYGHRELVSEGEALPALLRLVRV